MDALSAIRFVRGAVGKSNHAPEMSHYVIENGTIRSFNGHMALSSPIDYDLRCAPIAQDFFRALERCEDIVSLGMTPANRLRIQSGMFRAFIKCVDMDHLPHQLPTGDIVPIDGAVFVKALRMLEPFIGTDASRPWATGVLLSGSSAFATNNISLAQYWLGIELPYVINVPKTAIKEILRIGEAPTAAQLTDKSLTLHYDGGRWLRTALYETTWPELTSILEVEGASPQPINGQLFEALRSVKPFLTKRGMVHFCEGYLTTELAEGEGADYAVEGMAAGPVFNHALLSSLEGVAETIDFTCDPAVFYGSGLRGVMIGQRA